MKRLRTSEAAAGGKEVLRGGATNRNAAYVQAQPRGRQSERCVAICGLLRARIYREHRQIADVRLINVGNRSR